MNAPFSLALLGLSIGLAQAASAQESGAPAGSGPQARGGVEEIVVLSRRRAELAQDVPIPLSVVSGETLESKGTFNIARLGELQPSLQFYSSNPRNTAVNIRGIGAPFGLTNDGIEPGVGVYIDQIYHARPASTTFDFVDVAQVEVLRGPQGTLYGKNTTSGAINVTTRAPRFTPEGRLEVSSGDYNYLQARGYLSGPLAENVAGRLSFSSTRREGFLTHVGTGKDTNDLDNLGLRGQLLWEASDRFRATLHGDYSTQQLECCAQVYVGVVPTQRAANRQFPEMAADLGYTPPSLNPFDRLIDVDTLLQAHQEQGGLGVVAEWQVAGGVLTSVTAGRYWNWYPSNDRDFTSLPITTVSANPSKQRQVTQEIRFASDTGGSVDYVVGLFAYRQTIESSGNQEQGAAASRWLLAPAAGNTPELLDGLRQENDIDFENDSYALFGQLTWQLSDRLRLLPGLRLNYDSKETDFLSTVSGGLETSDPVLQGRKDSVLQSQTYQAASSDSDVSGQLTVAYDLGDNVNVYATWSKSFKSVGVNLSGIPNDASGAPALSAAEVKPERVTHLEAGVKSSWLNGLLVANVNVFDTSIRDYQANVVNAAVGVLRGYLANAGEVSVRGLEADLLWSPTERLSFTLNAAFTDGKYEDFRDAPCPLELTGAPGGGVCDVSGTRLPGISDVALSLGGTYSHPLNLGAFSGEAYLGVDSSYRSDFSSSPSESPWLEVDGYSLVNLRAGYRDERGWEVFGWVRNVADTEYFEFLSAQPGNSGMIVGQLGDPRTAGLTLNIDF